MCKGFPGGSVVENPPANAGDMVSVPGSGRSPGVGKGNPLQCSCLGNAMDRGAWQATVHMVSKSWTQLSTHAYIHIYIYIYRERDTYVCVYIFFFQFFSIIGY